MATSDVTMTFRVIRHPPPCHRCGKGDEQHRPLDAAAQCRGYVHPESLTADVIDVARAVNKLVWGMVLPRRWR